MYTQMRELLGAYRTTLVSDREHLFDQYRIVHMARKVVGVGSVGTRAWILLLEGLDGGDPLFLQAKEAQASVLEEYAGASEYTNHGERVVAGQRLMQAASDIFLGWQRTNGHRRRRPRLLPAPAARLEGLRRDRGLRARWHGHLRAGSADGRSPGPTHDPGTASPSAPTSARPTPSRRRSRTSRPPTPTRTTRTTRNCATQSMTAESPRAKACSQTMTHRHGCLTVPLRLDGRALAWIRRLPTSPHPDEPVPTPVATS